MATLPSICAGSVMAVGGRNSEAISPLTIHPLAKASSAKVPFGMLVATL